MCTTVRYYSWAVVVGCWGLQNTGDGSALRIAVAVDVLHTVTELYNFGEAQQTVVHLVAEVLRTAAACRDTVAEGLRTGL